MTWVRLEVGSNWGELFYAYPGERLNENGMNDTGNALLLHEGLETAVRFPDDWGAVVALRSKTSTFLYHHGDGKAFGVTRRWGFEMDVHGMAAWIPIESVDVVLGFATRARDSKEGAKR